MEQSRSSVTTPPVVYLVLGLATTVALLASWYIEVPKPSDRLSFILGMVVGGAFQFLWLTRPRVSASV